MVVKVIQTTNKTRMRGSQTDQWSWRMGLSWAISSSMKIWVSHLGKNPSMVKMMITRRVETMNRLNWSVTQCSQRVKKTVPYLTVALQLQMGASLHIVFLQRSLPLPANPKRSSFFLKTRTSTAGTPRASPEPEMRIKTLHNDEVQIGAYDEKGGPLSWVPGRCVGVTSAVEMSPRFCWLCEKFIRAYTVYVGVHDGIDIMPSLERVTVKCGTKQCPATFLFERHPRTGL